jgi:abortive infection bacteriophage resistance protein
VEYDKPHLTIPQQLAKLEGRGLVISDRDEAERLLVSVGYYRLSAYGYPFRELLPEGSSRDTTVQFRASDFRAGTTLESVRDLWMFDRRLRLLCVDALETVEVALRSRVGYHLGARHRFGYLDVTSLEPAAEARRRPGLDDGPTLFESWVDKYQQHQESAEAEDFITHYVEKYDAKLPIWVATETMDFGSLVRLYGFMRKDDQSAVARDLNSLSGAWLGSWIKVASYLRNVSAHHSRLWNRRLTYKFKNVPAQLVELSHLNEDRIRRAKVYGMLAILASTTSHLEPSSPWRQALVDHMGSFPVLDGVSPESDMGFPARWRDLPVWRPVV